MIFEPWLRHLASAVLAPFALVGVLLVAGCADQLEGDDSGFGSSTTTASTTEDPTIDTEESISAATDATDFFPVASGHSWTYEITFPGDGPDPHFTYEIYWSGLDDTLATVGRFLAPRNQIYELTLAVGDQGAPRLPTEPLLEAEVDVYEVEVVVDDLEIYNRADRVWWAIIRTGALMQLVEYSPTWPGEQVADYSPDEIGWGREVRVVAFDEPAGYGFYYIESDIIRSEGRQDPGPAECQNRPCLRLKREIAIGGGPSERLGGSVEELTWFADGIGLVRLEQYVDGTLSMVWSLAN